MQTKILRNDQNILNIHSITPPPPLRIPFVPVTYYSSTQRFKFIRAQRCPRMGYLLSKMHGCHKAFLKMRLLNLLANTSENLRAQEYLGRVKSRNQDLCIQNRQQALKLQPTTFRAFFIHGTQERNGCFSWLTKVSVCWFLGVSHCYKYLSSNRWCFCNFTKQSRLRGIQGSYFACVEGLCLYSCVFSQEFCDSNNDQKLALSNYTWERKSSACQLQAKVRHE